MAKKGGNRGGQRGHGRSQTPDAALNRLLATLRRGGDAEANYPLVVNHARALMMCAPRRSGNREWMLSQLPEQWHRDRVAAALSAAASVPR